MKKPTRLLITLLGAVASVLFFVSPAHAAGESIGACMAELLKEGDNKTILEEGAAEGATEEQKEALVELEEEMEGCVESPNLILPATAEIVWGGLAFGILLLGMWRYAFPLVKKGMEDRSEKIRTDLEEAQAARAQATRLKEEHEEQLAEARTEANRIIDDARQEAATVKSDLTARAEAEIAEMRRRADADVWAARDRALSDLQGEVSEIVVGAAERVVEQNLDRSAQQQLIDSYIANVGGSS